MTRSWLAILALVALPLLVYWPAATHEYGFRDDYAHLREIREAPGWLLRLTTAHGRPVYGHVLETSLSATTRVADLSALRLTGVLLLSVAAVLIWQHLRHAGWSALESVTFGAAVTLLPGAQVIASWAIAWPIALGLVLAIAGFVLVERGLAVAPLRRAAALFAGSLLYLLAALTYQTSALFPVALLAAVLLRRDESAARSDMAWALVHFGVLFVSLFSAWLLATAVIAYGSEPESTRMAFETAPLRKLLWFLLNPLPNALALFPLRDQFATPPGYFAALASIITIIALGFHQEAKTAALRRRWLFALLVLPFAAHSVVLAANSQAIGYRTLLPLSGLFLVLAICGLRAILRRFDWRERATAWIYGVVLVGAAWTAQHNSYTLIAEPQGRGWQLVKAAAGRLPIDAETQVYIVLPTLADRPTQRIYADEFGSLSADAEWAADEMFKAAVREYFPAGLPDAAQYTIDTGVLPPALPFDLVVDFSVLKQASKQSFERISASSF